MAAHPSEQSASSRANLPALIPLAHHQGKPAVPLTRQVTLIGARSNARIHLVSSTISKAHALLVKSNGVVYIRDLSSRTHVYVNGDQIRDTDLNDGDLIKLGSFTFKFKAGTEAPSAPKAAPAAELDVTGGQLPIPVEERVLLIGRRPTSDIVLLEESVSTAHAVIFEMDGDRYVRDLGSRSGTFVNGVSTHQHKLAPGDVIRVGETDLRFNLAAPAAIDMASDSGLAYALEAPRDELQIPSPVGEEHDTMGGLDLMGQIVREEVAREAAAAATSAKKPPEPIPLEPAEQDKGPIPLKEPVASAAEPAPDASADIEDLQDALLGEAAPEEESLSPQSPLAETTTRTSATPDVTEDVSQPQPRRGWRGTIGDEPLATAPGQQAQDDVQPVESTQRNLQGAEPTPQEQPEEVLRFAGTSPSSIDQADAPFDHGDTASAAVLDQDALADEADGVPPEPSDTLEPMVEIEPLEPSGADSRGGMKLDFSDSLPSGDAEPATSAPVDVSGIDLDLRADAAGTTHVDLSLEPPADETAPPDLDFSVKEPSDASAGVLDLSKLSAPPPPLKLTADAEALMEATQKLTKRRRRGKKASEEEEAARFVPIEPPPEPDPFAGMPPIQNFDPFAGMRAPTPDVLPPIDTKATEEEPSLELPTPSTDEVEVLDRTEPEPESALDLDEAVEHVGLDDSGVQRALAEPSADELTDTHFERVVREFAGDSIGDIVEPATQAEEPQTPQVEAPPVLAEPEPDLEHDSTPVPPTAEVPFEQAENRESDEKRVAVDAPTSEPIELSEFPQATSDEIFDDEPLVGASPEPVGSAPDMLASSPPIATGSTSVPGTDDLVIPREQDIPAAERATPPSPAPKARVGSPPSAPPASPQKASPQRASPPPASPPPPSAPAERAPAPMSRDPFLVGANQENFLGGIPVPPSPLPGPQKFKTKPLPFNRDPVEELIAEIDSAAAAAERARAQAGPGPLHEPPGLISAMDPFAVARPPQHPSRMRPVGRRGAEVGASPLKLDESIPPFAGKDPTGGAVTTGFDGLAMPPVRQVDVFSAMSPPGPEPLTAASQSRQSAGPEHATSPRSDAANASRAGEGALFANIAAAARADAATRRDEQLAGEPRARRPVRPALSDLGAGGRPDVVYAEEDELEFDPVEFKQRTNRRVWTLVLVMFALIGAGVAGTYTLFPVHSRLEASIRYLNLDKRTERDRREIQADQLRRLQSDYLREMARKKLLQTPEISPGFLEDPVKYTRVVDRAEWPEPRSGTVRSLVLLVEGPHKEAEAARLRALVAALYDDNEFTLRKSAREARSAVEQLNADIAKNTRRRDELNGEIASERILYEQKPTSDQLKLLEGKLARLEEAWRRAVASVKDTEAEQERIRTGAGGENPEMARDQELANMQLELEQLQDRATEARDASAAKARESRKHLDDAMAAFQQEIANAREAMKGNPDLAAYIAAAEQLQDATRQLIDDLIRRQEQQFNSLMELKARLNEKMETRRAEMWQADKELKDLTERLAILTRQFNAAVGGGLKNEAEDLRAQVDLTKSMIKARQELIPADPGYAEAIQQIEQFISSTQKNIEEDRRRTDELLAKLQRGFTSGPQIEKLPAEQKELAQRLVTKLESINEARTAYNASLDEGAAEGDAQLQQQIAALTAGIEARKKQYAEQMAGGVNSELFKQKQTQLETLRTDAKSAEEAFFAARQEVDKAKRDIADARLGYEKLEKLESERNQLQTLLKTQNDTLVERQRELATAVEPQPLGENDIRMTEGKDHRPKYAIIVSTAIAAVFMGLIVMTLYRGTDEASLSPSDLRPITHPVPQPTANGNGQGTARQPTGTPGNEDDRQPAVI